MFRYRSRLPMSAALKRQNARCRAETAGAAGNSMLSHYGEPNGPGSILKGVREWQTNRLRTTNSP